MILNKKINLKNFFSPIISEINKNSQTNISPLIGSSKSFFISELIKTEKQILILFPDAQSASEFFVELNILNFSNSIIILTDFKQETIQEKLTEISNKKTFILISTYEILKCKTPPKKKVEEQTTKIQVGGNLSFNDIIEYLNLLNYQKDKFVEAPGDYSQRGSIIDFWSYSDQNPVRLEFDGDFLESIRSFDPESQRSIETVETATLAPQLNSLDDPENSADIFDYLDNVLIIASDYELKNLNKNEISNLEKDNFSEEDQKENKNEFNLTLKENTRWLIESEFAVSNRIEIGFTEAPTINANYEILFSVLKTYSEQDFKIIITAENEFQSQRLNELLIESHEKLGDENTFDFSRVLIETLPIKKGFLHKKEKFLLLTDYEIFNKPYRTKISSNKKYKKSRSKHFASIKKGDYVVHEDYGIGKYAGLETIKIGEAEQESMKILFKDDGVVYVNLNYLTLVKKYSSNENLIPSLSALGTSEWQSTKQKAKRKIKEAARELIELYAKRKASKGFSFNPDTIWQKELEASFLYEDTPDQSKVTEEVKEDMEAVNPMDRLICGDVGFGKTEVAVRAAFKAVQDGKQVAVLVPTTILTEQHYNTFKDRLSQFPVKIESLSRFQTKTRQKEIVNDLKEGNIDIIIGTHRLISKDVKFKDLGLLIIDEEHRFGVMAKEKLKSLKLNVDTLTLTATPIPRTLNLSLLGARDLSIIATPPPNRQPIYTQVSTFDILKIKEWILNELRRNGQVYFVHDRVHSIEKLADYLNKNIPDIRIAIAHGQMKPSQLENVIHAFLNKKFDVLLSTKIIESGIDIPNVNTIIVNRADRFGLAELHQLRGRVGRSNRQAYAYFIVPSLSGINKKSLRRLQAIEEFTEVGAGFNISMRDLEIRGTGNLLGTEQTGFINDVGFDLYVKLINEAVEELKYHEFKEIFKNLPKQEYKTDPGIDAYFDIGIPNSYMSGQSDRLNFYTALYSIKNLNDLEELKEEMLDRFGPLPVLVKRLIKIVLIRLYASNALFERIIIQRKNIFLILPKADKEDFYKYKFIELMKFIMDNYKDQIKFSQQKETLKLIIPNNFETPEKILDFLIKFCEDVSKLFNQQVENVISME